MLPYAALTGPVPKAGVILVAALAAVVLTSPSPRLRALATTGALLLAPALLLADIWHSPQLRVVHHHPALAAAGLLAGLVVLCALAAAIVARPWLLAALAVLTLPFRVPIAAGGTTSNLLVPLYCVVAAGSLAAIWRALRPAERLGASGEQPAAAGSASLSGRVREWDMGPASAATQARAGRSAADRLPAWVARALAVYLVLYAIQALYSPDFVKALQQMVFFYVPFALLFASLTRLDWTEELARRCMLIAVALALVFAAIGFVEYDTKTIFLNPKLIAQNDVHAYFTVNSVFFDPDIFGRFLALAMIGLGVAIVYERAGDARRLIAVTAALAVLWAGLVLTLSRSSLGALLVGLGTLAALRFRATRILAAAIVIVALGAAVVAITPSTFGLNQGLNGASSGRASLVTGGIDMFGDRPLQGYGSGSFVAEYRARNKGTATTLAASHTIPVTIAAEQGLIGLGAYVALVGIALVVLIRGARRSAARAGVAAAFLALVFHTMLYADFLEDPTTWVLLAAGAAMARRQPAPLATGTSEPAARAVPLSA